MGDLADIALTTATAGFGGKYGIGSQVFGLKGGIFGEKDKKDAPIQQQQAKAADPTAPDAPKADVNKELIAAQGDRRKRFLLQQSTGRPPQAPSITNQTNNRSLLG